jgi:hypothetical protein
LITDCKTAPRISGLMKPKSNSLAILGSLDLNYRRWRSQPDDASRNGNGSKKAHIVSKSTTLHEASDALMVTEKCDNLIGRRATQIL